MTPKQQCELELRCKNLVGVMAPVVKQVCELDGLLKSINGNSDGCPYSGPEDCHRNKTCKECPHYIPVGVR